MKTHSLRSISAAVFTLLFSFSAFATGLPQPHSKGIAATVYNLTRVKILESNNVTLRPGSIYDNSTYFESLLRAPRPGYNYEFLDSGLGAAEPLYPMYQKGFQGSYAQLAAALLSKKSRHIDHYSSLDTPEGCRVDGIYLLRGLEEYPDAVFQKEREEGYTQTVIKLDYYTRLKPGAECGRHRANDPDPSFDPMKYMWSHRDAMSLEDFPQKELERFEAKLSAIYQIVEQLGPKHARFDLDALKRNSLWYYPDGHAADYGIRTTRRQPGLESFQLPMHMLVDATSRTQADFPLDTLLKADEFGKVLEFLNGKPAPGFDPATEPGHDVLNLADVTPKNIYTSGLRLERIQNVLADVSDPAHFKMVGMTIKPYEGQMDPSWSGERVIPQIRFVYQLMDPRDPAHAFEQLFLHLKWDVVDRLASDEVRRAQHRYFLGRADQLTRAREVRAPDYDSLLKRFIEEFTAARPVESVSFSSSLTGLWVFGSLSRENAARNLQPVRIVRQGVDFGYYSSSYDNDLVRAELARAQGDRKAQLQKYMDSLTVGYFRDPKRQDVRSISFNRVTCAQCHQTSGRDGIHMMLNDGLDSRIRTPAIVSEYFFHDADLQLENGARYWQETPAK